MNPYKALPPHAFWRAGVADDSPFSPREIYRKKFAIDPKDRIATAGSCFAQHIGRHLARNGFNVLDVEPPPPWTSAEMRSRHGYQVYSARYGNLYTLVQLAQLALEAMGKFTPQDAIWRRDDRYVDAFRPAIEPDGWEFEDDVRMARKHHLGCVRELFRQMDVFVFTLGLTETWIHKPSGTCFGSAPGTVAGSFDPAIHAFMNLNYTHLMQGFARFVECLQELRDGDVPRIILTVSPVPLTATASGAHVLPATAYSKAVLRAVAGDLAQAHSYVDYFPSYEIVTHPAAHGAFFDTNLRTVRTAGVEAVMRTFFAAHGQGATPSPPLEPSPESGTLEDGVQCEDALLEAFAE
jgi:hypothetical protein